MLLPVWIVSLFVRYTVLPMFDPFNSTPRPNRNVIYFGACIIAGICLAREIFNRVFRKVAKRME